MTENQSWKEKFQSRQQKNPLVCKGQYTDAQIFGNKIKAHNRHVMFWEQRTP